VNFPQAITSGFEKYATFQGRATRPEFWYWVLFSTLVSWAGSTIDFAIGSNLVVVLANLALLLPGIAVGVRRFHDINRSGWWVLISLVPLVGWIISIVMLTKPSDPGLNRFD